MKYRIMVNGTFGPKYYGPFKSARDAGLELKKKGWRRMRFYRGNWSRNEESDPVTTKVARVEVIPRKPEMLAPSELPKMN